MRRRAAPLVICLLAVPALALAPGAEGEVGDTLSLKGLQGGEELDVTVTKIVDPTRAEDDFLAPDPDERLVAVQFRLENTGSETYSDSPQNGASVVDQDDQRFKASHVPATAGVELPTGLTVRPGGKALGYLTFEVPDGSRIVAVEFAMNSGFAKDVGEWKVPEKKPATS
ncbi:DUF4352 domain-containing protein [Streptomyces sp. enrichment culture]|uniref:DUF4352 domain-containing protein n=1 Tax=Streptomyces sp. enrichment culture TaxID=1795815 RepID=UPI003F560C69